LNQQLAAVTSFGVRFIATSQSLDTDEKNPTSRLLLQILASVAEFEREMIRERTLSGINAAQAAGRSSADQSEFSGVTKLYGSVIRKGCPGGQLERNSTSRR
jgi:DNA invertase Pin-like site-specific DNA recombinase